MCIRDRAATECFSAKELLELPDTKTTTMNRKQKNAFLEGIDTIALQEKAKKVCLAATTLKPETKSLALVTPRIRSVIPTWLGDAAVIVDVPDNIDARGISAMRNKFSATKPTFVLSCWGVDAHQDDADIRGYFEMLEEFVDAGSSILHIDNQWNSHWPKARTELSVYLSLIHI